MDKTTPLFLDATNGKVWGYGANECGQLGIKKADQDDDEPDYVAKPQQIPLLEDIVSIASGSHFNLCLDKHGKVWVFGHNGFQQLGLGPDNEDEVFRTSQYKNATL